MDEVLSWVQTDTTTVNIAGPTKLQVVVSVLAVVCKCMQQRWDMQSIERRMQPLRLWRPCVMRMHGPYNVERAVQMDPTLLHFTSVISWQNKRNVGSCRLKTLTGFKLCTTTASNMQQHVTSNNVGSCWPTMLNSFELGLTQKNKVWSVTQLLPGPVFINLSLWH